MKVMISQPMRGKTEEQIKLEREEVVKELEEEGWEVLDTVFTDEAPKECSEAIYFLSKSIEALSKADAVLFLAGWEGARGCRIEYQVAQEYGKFIKCK